MDPLGKWSLAQSSIIWIRETRLDYLLIFFDMRPCIVWVCSVASTKLKGIYGSCIGGSGHNSSVMECDTRLLILWVIYHHPGGYMVRVHMDPFGKRTSSKCSIIRVQEHGLLILLCSSRWVNASYGSQGTTSSNSSLYMDHMLGVPTITIVSQNDTQDFSLRVFSINSQRATQYECIRIHWGSGL